ncbi:MAG: PQQ-binding-like beta-propeller repeat protein [Candidatus Heimdallarchaeota archaeon]|nr:PQQ-binding-like beta-propeller repeat protein [Candidatus Heimdallarchaeota archaeon]
MKKRIVFHNRLFLVLLMIGITSPFFHSKIQAGSTNSITAEKMDVSIKWDYLPGPWIYESADSPPATADLDGDGLLETIVGGHNKRLHVINFAGKKFWTINVGEGVHGGVAIGDLNQDGQLELVFGGLNGKLYAANTEGKIIWIFTAGAEIYATPMLADITGNSSLEILFGADNGKFYCLNAIGECLWSYQAIGQIRSSASVADLDNDKEFDVIFGSADRRVYCLNNQGEEEWSYLTNDGIISSPAIVNNTKTNQLEVIIGSGDGTLYCVNGSGEIMWTFETPGSIYSSPAIADLRGDGTKEVVFGSSNILYCLDLQGKKQWQHSFTMEINCYPLLGDLDGDNLLEVVIGSENGKVYCLRENGSLVWSFQTRDSITHSGTIADVDADGKVEVLYGGYNKFYCLELTGITQSGTIPWSTFKGSNLRTGWGDRDGDGLDNFSERQYGTDNSQADTDGDTIIDGLELQLGLDPFYNMDALADADGDTISNREELTEYHTSMFQMDSDQDGLSDDWELAHNHDPLAWDNWQKLFSRYFIPVYVLLVGLLAFGTFLALRPVIYQKKIIEGNFGSFREYLQVKQAGYKDRQTWKVARSQGFQTKEQQEAIKERGFDNYPAFFTTQQEQLQAIVEEKEAFESQLESMEDQLIEELPNLSKEELEEQLSEQQDMLTAMLTSLTELFQTVQQLVPDNKKVLEHIVQIHEELAAVDTRFDAMTHRLVALKTLAGHYHALPIRRLEHYLDFPDTNALHEWIEEKGQQVLAVEDDQVYLLLNPLFEERTEQPEEGELEAIEPLLEVRQIFPGYNGLIYTANIITILLFFWELTVYFFFRQLPTNYPLLFLIITTVTILFSALCYGDFVVKDNILHLDYNVSTKESLQRKVTLKDFTFQTLFYMGVNCALYGFNLFWKMILTFKANEPWVYKISMERLYRILFFYELVAFSLIIIAIIVHIRFYYTGVKRYKQRITLISCLAYLMLAGGDSLVSYLIVILWIITLLAGIFQKKQSLSPRTMWREKERISTDFFDSFHRGTELVEIVFSSLPIFLFVAVFIISIIGNFNFLIASLTIIFLIGLYYLKKRWKSKPKTIKIEQLLFGLFSIGLMGMYIYYMNNVIGSLFSSDTFVNLFGLRLHSQTIVLLIVMGSVYSLFVLINYQKIVSRKNHLLRIKLNLVINEGAFVYLTPIYVLLLLLMLSSEISWVIIVGGAAVFTVINHLLVIFYIPKKLFEEISATAKTHNVALSLLTSTGWRKYSMLCLGLRKLLKKKQTK